MVVLVFVFVIMFVIVMIIMLIFVFLVLVIVVVIMLVLVLTVVIGVNHSDRVRSFGSNVDWLIYDSRGSRETSSDEAFYEEKIHEMFTFLS